MTSSASLPLTRTEALRLLIDDHLPAYLRLPSDFLVWTGVPNPELNLCGGHERHEHRPPAPTAQALPR